MNNQMTDCNCGMLACPRCFPAHDEVGQHYHPWWGHCNDCGYLIDTPNHVIGCKAEREATEGGIGD